MTISNCIGVNGDSGIWSILNWSVVDPIASGVDLEYTELVLTTEHPLQHLDIPEMNFYARWASL